MLIYARGTAVIQHGETSETFTVHSDELDWEPIAGSERSMGPETVYQALVEHEELGELRWSITEYPADVENVKETDVGKHHLIEDFDYGLEHEQEAHDDPSDLRDRIKDNPEWAKALTQSAMVRYLTDWFGYFYEDPANSTPYNGQEGGYQYVYGGPYNAEEELRLNFEDIVSDDAILKAVEELESEGTFDWAPTSHHPDKIAFFEEALEEEFEQDSLDFDQFRAIAASAKSTLLGSADELTARHELIERIQSIRKDLPRKPQHGGIGHNHPPTEFELQGEQLDAVETSLGSIEAELTAEVPSIELVASKSSKLKSALGWVAAKLDKTVDEFCKAFGATLGKTAGVALPAALLAMPYWSKLAALVIDLKAWILLALGI